MQETSIRAIVRHVAEAPVLLVASDFDGAISPIVGDPKSAKANPSAIDALHRLASMPRTRAAIISGRSLEDLGQRLPKPDGLLLVGSHGAELPEVPSAELSIPARQSLKSLAALLAIVTKAYPGARTEVKTRGVAFHYRMVDDARVAGCLERVLSLKDVYPVRTRLGSMVIEFVADTTTKADAIQHLRKKIAASAVVFIGDDLTDEDGFSVLSDTDAGVKVGHGDSLAAFRVRDVADVSLLLCALAEARQTWLDSSRAP